jgi:hypothetical protein
MEQIQQTYIGDIGEKETIDEVEGACAFAGGDFALELRGDSLHIFRIMTGVRA